MINTNLGPCLTLYELLERWKGMNVDGVELDLDAIYTFVRNNEINLFLVTDDYRISRGQKICEALPIGNSPQILNDDDYEAVKDGSFSENFVFSLQNIKRFEKNTLRITGRVLSGEKPLVSSTQAALQSKNAELEAKIKALEAQLEKAKQAYPEAPQEPEAPEAQADAPARGKAGRAANSEKALARWQAVIPAMLEVWHSIMSAEVEQYTRAKIEYRLTKANENQAPSTAQLNFFMDCLPSEYKVPQSGSEKK